MSHVPRKDPGQSVENFMRNIVRFDSIDEINRKQLLRFVNRQLLVVITVIMISKSKYIPKRTPVDERKFPTRSLQFSDVSISFRG